MYGNLPRPQRAAIRSTLSAGWVLVAGAGLSAALVSPYTIIAEVGNVVLTCSGLLVLLSALVAAAGVAFGRYHWEWWAAWFASAGITPYVGTVLWLVASGEVTRLTQAFSVSALLVFCITRALLCSAHAAKLREAHDLVARDDGR